MLNGLFHLVNARMSLLVMRRELAIATNSANVLVTMVVNTVWNARQTGMERIVTCIATLIWKKTSLTNRTSLVATAMELV